MNQLNLSNFPNLFNPSTVISIYNLKMKAMGSAENLICRTEVTTYS